MKRAKTVMIQGTASSVGKSLIVAALCRIFRDQGLSVAPFKSQNMALNSYVTPDGGEIGRAQAVQAEAAGIEPTVEMNPILLKPEPEMRSQVVLLGKPIGSMHWSDYCAMMPSLQETIRTCIETLRASHDLVVIEGAGSPAEINLRRCDIANMHVAKVANAPVILAGDIDKGGVFAQLVGTMELLEPAERKRVAGFLINKFRGEVALLKGGLDFLQARCGIPVLGVIPWISRLRIADEDSVPLQSRTRRLQSASELYLAVVKLPFISNYDDFLALEHEPGVHLRFIDDIDDLEGADLVIIPGTKSSVSDLAWMRREGFASAIIARAERGGLVLGICGGCQMLGETIEDPHAVESREPLARGLGLLPLRTRFEKGKTTARVVARPNARWFAADGFAPEITGYEIHMGSVTLTDSAQPAFTIISRNGDTALHADGAVSSAGNTVGTMLFTESLRTHPSAARYSVSCGGEGVSPRSVAPVRSWIAMGNTIGSQRQ
jgi:adenosylcobyric acid synthase